MLQPSEQTLPPIALLEPKQLIQWLGEPDLLIVDVCKPATYQQLHLPGAIHISPSELVCGVQPATGMLPPLAQIQALMDRISYSPDKTIVVYDDEGGGWAGRLLWTLDLIGHQKLAYLNGGLHAWLGADCPVEHNVEDTAEKRCVTAQSSNSPVTTPIQISQPWVRITAEELLEDRHQEQPLYTIWDTRSPAEFSGERQLATRGGHIPGAINFEWTQGMDTSRQLRIREDIREVLVKHGLGAEHSIVTHCHSHHRSGFAYLIARVLCYPHIRAYDGSWSEWGNRKDTPVAS